MVFTLDIATDDDGSLKIKRVDQFFDSKAYVDFFKVVEEAKANRVRCVA